MTSVSFFIIRRFLSSRCKNDSVRGQGQGSGSGVKGRDHGPALFNILKTGRSKANLSKQQMLRTNSSTSLFTPLPLFLLLLSCVGRDHRSEQLASAAAALVTGLQRAGCASGSPASTSRSPPEPERAPPCLRPTEPRLRGGQYLSLAQLLPLFYSFSYPSASELTCLLCHYSFEEGEWKVGRVRRFDQVTGVGIGQRGQQVAVPSPLHHLFHLERRQRSYRAVQQDPTPEPSCKPRPHWR